MPSNNQFWNNVINEIYEGVAEGVDLAYKEETLIDQIREARDALDQCPVPEQQANCYSRKMLIAMTDLVLLRHASDLKDELEQLELLDEIDELSAGQS